MPIENVHTLLSDLKGILRSDLGNYEDIMRCRDSIVDENLHNYLYTINNNNKDDHSDAADDDDDSICAWIFFFNISQRTNIQLFAGSEILKNKIHAQILKYFNYKLQSCAFLEFGTI